MTRTNLSRVIALLTTLAALALAVATSVTSAPLAQAQADETELFRATMTVGRAVSYPIMGNTDASVTSLGYHLSASRGSLTHMTFNRGGNEYSVARIEHVHEIIVIGDVSDTVFFRVLGPFHRYSERDGGIFPEDVLPYLTFHVGEKSFALQDVDSNLVDAIEGTYEEGEVVGNIFVWFDDPLDLAEGDTVTVRLTERQPSGDATLKALSVTGDGDDVSVYPPAGRDRTAHTAGVVNGVDEVTVTATPSDSAATVAYSGTDAKSGKDGHQVDLDVCENTVTITVTAEDGTTRDYTLTILRGAAGTPIAGGLPSVSGGVRNWNAALSAGCATKSGTDTYHLGYDESDPALDNGDLGPAGFNYPAALDGDWFIVNGLYLHQEGDTRQLRLELEGPVFYEDDGKSRATDSNVAGQWAGLPADKDLNLRLHVGSASLTLSKATVTAKTATAINQRGEDVTDGTKRLTGEVTYTWNVAGSTLTPGQRYYAFMHYPATRPGKPTGLTATAVPGIAGALNVSWTAPTGDPAAVGYRVLAKRVGGSTGRYAWFRKTKDTSMVLTLLEPNTVYDVWVQSSSAIAWGSEAGPVRVTTNASSGTNDPVVELDVPTTTVTEGDDIRVRLKFTGLTDLSAGALRANTGRFQNDEEFQVLGRFTMHRSFVDDRNWPGGGGGCGGVPVRSGGLSVADEDDDGTWEVYQELSGIKTHDDAADYGPMVLSLSSRKCGSGLGPDRGFVRLGSKTRECVDFADDSNNVTNSCGTRSAQGGTLKARFQSMPTQHDGKREIQARVSFSEPIDASAEQMSQHGVRVDGGQVTSARQVPAESSEGRSSTRSTGSQETPNSVENVWEFQIEPGSGEDVTVILQGGGPCSLPDAICTADGRALSEGISATVEGPTQPLTAQLLDVPRRHNGEHKFALRVEFSDPVTASEEAMRSSGLSVSGGTVTSALRLMGRADVWTITIQPDSSQDVTVTATANRPCDEAGALCTADGRMLSAEVSATVDGVEWPEGDALTVRFESVPASHDGETEFHFKIAFSEGVSVIGHVLRDYVLSVDGGLKRYVFRVDNRRDLYEPPSGPGGPGTSPQPSTGTPSRSAERIARFARGMAARCPTAPPW